MQTQPNRKSAPRHATHIPHLLSVRPERSRRAPLSAVENPQSLMSHCDMSPDTPNVTNVTLL